MNSVIAVKWTLKETYRTRLGLHDLFDPTTDFEPVYSEILAKLRSCTPVNDLAHTQALVEPISLEIRLSGSKEYVALEKKHRAVTAASGRARIRVAGQNAPQVPKPIDLAPKEIVSVGTARDAQIKTEAPLREFMNAGSAPHEMSAKVPFAGPAKKTYKHIVVSQAVPEVKQDKDDSAPPLSADYITRAEVCALIDAKVSELQTALSSKAQTKAEDKNGPARASQTPYKHNAVCDFCDKAIVGARWKCLTCPDFDSCDVCRSQIKTDHAGHEFVQIMDDSIMRSTKQKAQTYHPGALCDGPACKTKQTPIRGDRYKCTICPDCDLCAGCEVHPQNEHNITHPMVKLKESLSKIAITVAHDDQKTKKWTRCHGRRARDECAAQQATQLPSLDLKQTLSDALSKLRDGTAYSQPSSLVKHYTVCCDSCNAMIKGDRFMCATCPNFDFCQTCYEKESHPSDHVFVRYKRFVNNIIQPRLYIPAVATVPDGVQKSQFYCNVCRKSPQTGKRYSCLVCADWDACSECKDDHVVEGGDHAMQIIPDFQVDSRLSSIDGMNVGEKLQDREEPVETKEPLIGCSTSDDQSLIQGFLEKLANAGKRTTVEDGIELSSTFVEDVSIPDGSVITAGTSFVKQWLVRNDGTQSWPAGVSPMFVGGADLSPKDDQLESARPSPVLQSSILPGQSVVVSIFLQAPEEPRGNVCSYFRLVTADHQRFGGKLWVDIDVAVSKSAAKAMNEEQATSPARLEHSILHLEDVAEPTMKDSVTESEMIFPSASMELPKGPESSNDDSASVAPSQHEDVWGSDDEVTLSDDEDYDVLDNESFSDE